MTKVGVAAEFIHALVNTSNNTVLVHSGKAVVRVAWVTTVLSAHTVLIYDGIDATGVLMATFAASSSVGDKIELYDVRFETGIFVDPDDNSTGVIQIIYSPDHEGLAGSGAGLP